MSKHDLTDREISEGRDYVRRFCLWEKQFRGFPKSLSLDWKSIPAKKFNKENLPNDKQGVYAFVVKPNIGNITWGGYILYVGKTEKQVFQSRFLQYFNETKKDKPRFWVSEMLKLWKESLFYYYAETPAADADKIENALLEALLPPNNEVFRGKLRNIKKEIYSR